MDARSTASEAFFPRKPEVRSLRTTHPSCRFRYFIFATQIAYDLDSPISAIPPSQPMFLSLQKLVVWTEMRVCFQQPAGAFPNVTTSNENFEFHLLSKKDVCEYSNVCCPFLTSQVKTLHYFSLGTVFEGQYTEVRLERNVNSYLIKTILSTWRWSCAIIGRWAKAGTFCLSHEVIAACRLHDWAKKWFGKPIEHRTSGPRWWNFYFQQDIPFTEPWN